MAEKPIIEIEVNDSQFKAFYDLFTDYKAKLKDMPAEWQALGAAMDEAAVGLAGATLSASDHLEIGAAQARIIADALRDATRAQTGFGNETIKSGKGLANMAESAKNLGANLFGIGKWLLKFGLAGAGLGALAGGFGFDALAGSALSRQTTAGGFGLTPGQLSSFQINSQGLLGTSQLQAAVDAQSDIRKSSMLAMLGIDYNDAQKMSPSDLAFEALKRARAAYLEDQRKKIAPMQDPRLSVGAAAMGLDLNTIRNAAMTSTADINSAQRATTADAAGLNFDRATGANWITLKKTLDKASVTIQTDLINTLVTLTPQITAFSKEVVGVVDAFLKGPEFKDIIADLKTGISELGDFLTKTDWKTVGADISQLAKELTNALIFLHRIPDPNKPKDQPVKPNANDLIRIGPVGDAERKKAADWIAAHDKGPLGLLGNGLEFLGQQAEIGIRSMAGQYDPAMIHALNTVASAKYKIPGGLMDRLSMDESGMGKNLVSGAGALGVYQFMPDTAKQYGINPLDTKQAADASAKMVSQLFAKYHDWAKTIAAYNWGAAHLEADIKKHGADWLRFAPKETQGAVANVLQGRQDSDIAKALHAHAKAIKSANKTAKAPTQVSITNATSARVAVSARAAAYT